MKTQDIIDRVRSITASEWMDRAIGYAKTQNWLMTFKATTEKTLAEYDYHIALCLRFATEAKHK